MKSIILKCILYFIIIKNCLVLGVTKCESKVELRAVLLTCPAKDSGCDDDDPLSLAMTAEETLILQSNNKNFQALKDEKEKGFPNAVKDCKRKLIITLKVKNSGKIPCDDEYIVIDHVFDPVTGGKGRLLSPVVLKLRQEQMIQLYGLQFQRVVNSDPFEEEKEAEKVCSVNPDNPTCGIAMYNGKPIPFSEGFCCSCDPKLNAKRQLSPISHGDSLLYQDSKLISQRNDRLAPDSISNAIINPNLVKLQKVSNSPNDFSNEKGDDNENSNEGRCPIKGLSPEKIPNYLMEHDHKIICRKEDFLNELCRLQDEKSKESTDIFNDGSSNSFDRAAVNDGGKINFGVNIKNIQNLDSINKKKFNSQKYTANQKLKFDATSPNLAFITSSYNEKNENSNNTDVLKNLINALVTAKDNYSNIKLSDNFRGKRENERDHNLSITEKKLTLQEKLNNFADSKNLLTSRRKRLLQLSHKRFRKNEFPHTSAKGCNAIMSVNVVQENKFEKPTLPEFFFYNDKNIVNPNEPSVLLCNSTYKPSLSSEIDYAKITNNDKIETSFTVPINVYKNLGKKYEGPVNFDLKSTKKMNGNICLEEGERANSKQNNLEKLKGEKESFGKIKNKLQSNKISFKNTNEENEIDFTTQENLDWNINLLDKKSKIKSKEDFRNAERGEKKAKLVIKPDAYNCKASSLSAENLNNLFSSAKILKNIKPTETPFLLKKNNLEKQEINTDFDKNNYLPEIDESSILSTNKYEKFLKDNVYDSKNKGVTQIEEKMVKLPKEKEKNVKEMNQKGSEESRYIKNEKKEPDYLNALIKLQADNKKNNYQNLNAKNSKKEKEVKWKNCQEHSQIKNEEIGQKKYFKFSSKTKIQGDRKRVYPLQQNYKESESRIGIEKIPKKNADFLYSQKNLHIKPKEFLEENIKIKSLGYGSDSKEKLQLKKNLYRPESSYEIPEQYFIFRSTKNEYPQNIKCYKNAEAAIRNDKNLNHLREALNVGRGFTMRNSEKYKTINNKESFKRYNIDKIQILSPQKRVKQFSRKDVLLDPESKYPNNGFRSKEKKIFFNNEFGDILESKKIRVKRTTHWSFEPAKGFFGSELQFIGAEDFEKGGKEHKKRQIVHELEKCSSTKNDWPKAKFKADVNLISGNTEFPESNHNIAKHIKNKEIFKGKNKERLSRSYLNAPDYVLKKQKLMVKKKRGTSDQIKESKVSSRSKENCKKNLDLEGYSEDTAHCMRFGDLWYSVYLIKKPVVSQIVGIQLFDKHARCDGSTQWRDLTKGKMVRIGTFLPKAEDELPTISTTFLGGKTKKFESAIDPDNYLLLIPSHLSDPSKVSYYPQVDGGPAEYLVVESKDVSSGGECNMIGTSFEAFVRQPDRCSQPKGSCLKRQPIDLWREDMEARIRGKRGKYFVENFGTVSNSPIKTYTNFSGEFLALEYYGDYTSTIEIEVKADFNAIVRKGSNAQIPTVYVDGTYPKKTRIILSVLNIGLTSSYFRPRLGDCPPNLDPAWCPLEGPLVTIPPHQRHDFRLDLSGALPPNKILVTVQVLNQLNKKIAYRKIIIKKGDRCICAFHCKCNCIGRLKEGRVCNKLPVEDYRGAGYVGPFPFREGAAPTSTESIQGNFKVILLTATYVLLILGTIKGLLGIFIRRMGIAGTRVIVGPRKILKYYENELECCSVLFDECGFPVHPTTCLPVQIVPLYMEVIINIMFFFLYPLRGFWFFFLSLPCFTSFCEGCEVCCRQEGNYDYDKNSSHPLLPQNMPPTCVNYVTTAFSARKGKADEYLPYLPYKGDDDPLEEVDTEFVLQEMKKCRKN